MLPRARPWNGSLLIETGAECKHRRQIVTDTNNKRTFQRTSFSLNSARTLTHYIFEMNVRNNYGRNQVRLAASPLQL